jgi:signal transduction histidine kinase
MLLEVEEMKTNFLQLVTHDLKTPVARIQGLTESLKRSLTEKLTTRDHEMMNHILLANEDLNHFISALLELTKIDNQGVRVQLQAKDINQLLETILLKHRFSAQAKGIQIVTNFEPMFPIKFDSNLIGKVLSNLIDNAVKYSPANTKLIIDTREVDSQVEVTIQDQGIGIPDEELPNLFSRFFRVKNDTTQKVKGTGLGLYLSKYFIEAHQGRIQVESAPGRGTKFTIRLPIDLSEANLVQIGLTTSQPGGDRRGFFKKEKTHA